MITKRGSKAAVNTNAGSVAVLVILIALFIVIYVMMLSPEDRDALLFNQTGDTSSSTSTTPTILGKSILSQVPGNMIPESNSKTIHKIGPVDLYIKEDPTLVDLSSMLTLSKTMLSEKIETLSFKVNSIENLDKANLFFNAQEGKGNLIALLNGNNIFNSEVLGVGSIVLPTHLMEEDNTLVLKVSSPGLFGKNAYTLVDVKARIKYELTNTKEIRSVLLSAGETGSGQLTYFIYCKNAGQGSRMRVYLNEEQLSDEVVSCISGERQIDIPSDKLKAGKQNDFMFTIDGGEFLINDIKLVVGSETPGYVEYKFPITDQEYKAVVAEKADAKLYLEFSGGEERKAQIAVNGYEFDVDTEDREYTKDITRFIKEDNNYLRIVPKREFVIDSLEIKFE